MNKVSSKLTFLAHNITSTLRETLTKPVGRITLLVLVGIMITIQLVMLHNLGTDYPPGYTSDDVSQQTILAQWTEGYTAKAVLGDDNWALKFPLYLGMNLAPVTPAARIFITSWILTIATVLGSILALWAIALRFRPYPKKKLLLLIALPIVAVAALSPRAIYIISIVNTRNIEIPLFLLLLLALLHFDDPGYSVHHHRYAVAGVIALIGVLLADDPLFLYMGAIPLIGLLLLRSVFSPTSRLKSAQLGAMVVAGWLVSQILRFGLTHLLPITFYPHHSSLPTLSVLATNIGVLFTKDLELFNIYFRGPLLSFSAAETALALGLFALGLYTAMRLAIYRGASKSGQTGLQYFGLLPFWIMAVLLATTFNSGVPYLILVPFILAGCISLATAKGIISLKLSALIAGAFLLCAVANTTSAATMLAKNPMGQANLQEQSIVQTLRGHGLTKGFATYWHANIVTFLSGYSITTISVSCNTPGLIRPYNVLEEPAILNKPASRTFVIFYPSRERDQRECTLPQIVTRFGAPSEILVVPNTGGAKIAVYDHDITSRLSPGVQG
jgi:hypothetical protein